MEYRRLGATGTKVSELCFGTWRFGMESDGSMETDRGEAHDLLDAYVEGGGNFIDTANVYGGGKSEEWIGDWLADYDREEFVIASKVYWNNEARFTENLSRKNVRAEIRGTLDRLGTDYLDLYYIHRWDEGTPVLETLRALNDLVREGKVHSLGASTMAAWRLTRALWESDVHDLKRFDVTQPRFNAVYRDEVAGYLDLCADQELAVCPYSPLEGGFLTGKYERDGELPEGSRGDLYTWGDRFDDRQWRVLDAIREVADERGATPAQVSLRWLMDQSEFTCVPIVGARTVDQMEDNLGAADVTISGDEHDRITEAWEESEA